MPSSRPLPIVIGPTENALRAVLTQTLSSTAIPGYPAWVVLNAASSADLAAPGGSWRRAAADGLKVDPSEIDGILRELSTAGLLDDEGTLTDAGAAELAAARSMVMATTLRLVDGIDETEQQTTRRVLDLIRHNAEELLSA